MDLQQGEIRMLAGLIQSSRPELWKRLPLLQRIVEDLVRNIKPDLSILQELYEQAQERSVPAVVDLEG